MGDIRYVYTRCPLCGHFFRAPSPQAYVTVGRESDLCPKFSGRQVDGLRVLRNEITMCPVCSFATQEQFHEVDLSFDQRYELETRLAEDGLLRVFKNRPTPWLPFHAAEVCGQKLNHSAFKLGDTCLRASWVCRGSREYPFESTFQLRAIRYFMGALKEEAVYGRELSVTTYLIGELNRRLGQHREALNWYVNAERTLQGNPSLAWLDRLISEQRKLAQEQAA